MANVTFAPSFSNAIFNVLLLTLLSSIIRSDSPLASNGS